MFINIFMKTLLTLFVLLFSSSVLVFIKKYGGQFHFDIFGLKKTRKILGMDGFAGQQILIDLDNKRIIVVNSLFKNYDWKKIVHKKIKN
jgi:hypothetical protein